jgi:hypothetical protein
MINFLQTYTKKSCGWGFAMGDLQRGERLQIMLSGEELAALDEWRFTKRMPSRASAIRELLKRGLAAEGFELAAVGSKSADYGIIAGAVDRPDESKAE